MRYQFKQGASELSGQSLGVAGAAIDHHQVICGNCQKPGHLTDKCYRGVNTPNAPSVIRKRKQVKRDEESRKKPSQGTVNLVVKESGAIAFMAIGMSAPSLKLGLKDWLYNSGAEIGRAHV